MSKYDAQLETLIINGVNVTHFGDTICEVSFDGDWTETRKGRKGDAVTDALYTNKLQIRTTILPTSPQLAQWDTWAKSRNPHNAPPHNPHGENDYVELKVRQAHRLVL